MLIVPEFGGSEPQIRTHPWGKTEYAEGGGGYYDFRTNPALIRQVLEDFTPHASQSAVQRFYGFLEWINGPESSFETNDCALRAPFGVDENMFRGTRKIDGRFEVLHRDVSRNLNEPYVAWIMNLLFLYTQVTEPRLCRGVLSIKAVKTRFLAAPTELNIGHRLRITFNAYGSSDADAWATLDSMFERINEVFGRIQAATRETVPVFP